jgi:hypothetical protein
MTGRALLVAGVLVPSIVAPSSRTEAQTEPPLVSVPRASCGTGSEPEPGRQGRASAADIAAHGGRPFTCNTELVGHQGTSGGFKTLRYVDAAGHECAYYDTTFLLGLDVFEHLFAGEAAAGVAVLDMADPSHPAVMATLTTPAMLSPHESLALNQERGLLAAVMGNPVAFPGIVDLYDVSQDCRHPTLLSSSPVALLGHESGFSADGNTFYASSLITGQLTAIDVTDPTLPVPLWLGLYSSHGVGISADGNRAYLAALNVDGTVLNGGLKSGLVILDTSSIQSRQPAPQPSVISTLQWTPRSAAPQIAFPVTIDGREYLIEVDEFSGPMTPDTTATPGVARIIDIDDEQHPFVVSNVRLEVHQPENLADQQGDPGATNLVGGYAGHYCAVPRTTDPNILACSFVLSGLRVFDIRDPAAPVEIAYFNNPPPTGGSYALSAPAFVPERSEIWYSDGATGFYVVRLTNGVWQNGDVGPPPTPAAGADQPATTDQTPTPDATTPGGRLPATGSNVPLAATIAVVMVALVLTGLRSRSR